MFKKFLRELIRIIIFLIPHRIFLRLIARAASLKKGVILYYDNPEKSKIFDLINKVRKEVELLVSDNEAYSVVMCVKRTEKIGGDIAEIGVYQGGTARLICETKKNKPLHLFDTFCGIPQIHGIDQPHFAKGQYSSDIEDVRAYLSKYESVYLYAGVFPTTSSHITDKKFSLVHLDVDTHVSTLSCLEFFYPRLSRGGIILCHDYMTYQGVRSAVDGFFKDKPEAVIEIADTQCLIIKL